MDIITVDFKTMMLVLVPEKQRVTVISKLTGQSVCLPMDTFEVAVREGLKSKGYAIYE